jgi:6-phosphogluconolactonase
MSQAGKLIFIFKNNPQMRKILFLASFFPICFSLKAQKNPGNFYLLVGTYTTGKSDGIYVYDFDSRTGDATQVNHVKTSNPSYLAISPNEKFVYAVNENAPGAITAFSFDKKDGSLSLLDSQSSQGNNPCYVAVDKNGKFVAVGNYSSGTLSIFPVEKNGSLGPSLQTIEHAGYSVNSERQEGPHVHATVFSPDNHFLFVPDLGIDKLMIYNFDEKSGKLSTAEDPFEMTEPGAGPRHVVFHPNQHYAYLIQELTGNISAYKYSKGQIELIQDMSALPPQYLGSIGSADIHVSPDGNFLYASNRGESNTIGIYEINKKNGMLQYVGHQSTLGKTPRNFNFDPSGNFLLVANQNSDEVVIFKIDKKTGLLTDTGKRIAVGNPVCIKWIPVK